MKNFTLLTLIIFLIGTSQLFAQKAPSTATPKLNVIVKGQVIDSLTNETLPYATLKITTAQNPEKPVKLLATDDVGKFQIAMNEVGEFLLSIQYVGKTPSVTPFEVKSDEKLVDLDKVYVSDNQTLSEVVVTAFKPLVSVDLDKITYNTQDDPDSKTNNVLEMLRKVPMVTIDAEDNIELKGSTSYKIYMDGKPSNLISSNPSQVLRSMPANSVKSIEVITDPGAKYDAEGVTGIINIITNKQPLGGYTANVNAGVTSLGGYNAGLYTSIKYGKFGFTGSYNYGHQQSPSSPYETYTENYTDLSRGKYLIQNGSNKQSVNFQYGSGEFSYEIDTLNLLSASFNKMGGEFKNPSDLMVEALNTDKTDLYSYEQNGQRTGNFGGNDINVNYQRTFKKKDELLTASYKYSFSPNDTYSDTRIDSIFNFQSSWRKEDNDASDKEHTMQVDYTTPIANIHTIEGGAKYIIRLNESSTDRLLYDFSNEEWEPFVDKNADQFNYRYDIMAGYLGYNLKYQSYGFKAGLRFEDTQIEATYPLNDARDFDKHYSTWVPSATFTYRFQQVHNLRLGYNMRIQRPGIYYLNPYVNMSDPRFVTSGNPNLEVEKSHNIGLNYSVFKQKINLNANLNYSFTDNSIQRFTEIREIDGDIVNYTTFDNIGKQNRTSLDMYLNWNPNMKLRMYVNGSTWYESIETNNGSGISNDGFSGRLFGNVQYSLPKDFRISLRGGGGAPQITLQGERSGFYFTSIGIDKSFLNKKLTISLSGTNLFQKYLKFSNTTKTDDFYSKTTNNFQSRNVSLRVSYQFGEMKQQIQKVKRGISNDDSKAGDSNSQGENGSSGGNAQ